MVQEHQDCQLHSSSSHHERTYTLSRQEWCKGIKTVSFIPAPATMRELTLCQGKNGARASRLSASFKLQPPRENLQSIKARMVQGHQDCQLHSNWKSDVKTNSLARQEWYKGIKTV